MCVMCVMSFFHQLRPLLTHTIVGSSGDKEHEASPLRRGREAEMPKDFLCDVWVVDGASRLSPFVLRVSKSARLRLAGRSDRRKDQRDVRALDATL